MNGIGLLKVNFSITYEGFLLTIQKMTWMVRTKLQLLHFKAMYSSKICREDVISDFFLTGPFLDKLKLVKTMPLHKKGSTLNMSNYRPMSLWPILAKYMRKLCTHRHYTKLCTLDSLCQFVEKSKLSYSLQFGFRAKHSTNNTLLV